MADKERYQQGMAVRRKVLGDAHVDRTVAKLSPLNEEFQDFITRYAWGETWTRPGQSPYAQHDNHRHADCTQPRSRTQNASEGVI